MTLEGLSSVAILGAGKIGGAFVRQILQKTGIRVYATGRRVETLRGAESLGAVATRDNDEAVRRSELVVIAVKPYHFPQLLSEVKQESWKGKIVVSLMAGVKLATLRAALHGAKVFRAMPNLNAYVGKSSTAVSENLYDDASRTVEEFLGLFGQVYWVPEEYLDVWTGLAGSGPAFIAEVLDALAMGAVAAGMPRELSYKAVLDVLEGTAILLKNGFYQHPAMLRDDVTTPAGTTIRGLMVLESGGVKATLMKVIEAAARRSREIGNEIDSRIREKINSRIGHTA
ncbi:pyrroline-5-carboxylate reductase [Thermofilum pendens]|uniref:Pyrroline-5-carboxylate reductase n=1 Tax=Thermofilum pendens (strain DSM 2475 / Hrk 5) TaxID=368408 RepID=A1S1A4_THEPD|nr:pyrroline-5-carboxylate reductase [Thermofilum pendens]ABL79234.1 pyrroline-5-carboxylate reductase [Thermofilum pendens Hrk 5]